MSKYINRKILPLETLRGIAALSVAILHFQTGSNFNNEFTNHAQLMVDFFFILSGFVISLNYQHKIQEIRDILIFQNNRFIRLYPLHFLMLFAFLGIEFLKLFLVKYTNFTPNQEAFTGSRDLYSFVMNLFLLQNLTLKDLTWNFPSWSISAEFFVYFVFALIVLIFRKNTLYFILTSLTIIIISWYVLYLNGMGTSNISGPARCLYSFFLGVLAFNVFRKYKHTYPGYFAFISLMISVGLIIYIGINSFYSLFVPVFFAITVFIVSSTCSESIVYRVLSLRPFVYLGTISYGIYMIHIFVWYGMGTIARVFFHVRFSPGLEGKATLNIESVIISDAVTAFGIIIIIFLSHCSYIFVERPLNNYRHSAVK